MPLPMARPLRLEYPGAYYHVINRGNYRRDVFGQEGAKATFERTLFEAAERFGWRLHAYVIMRNHFHLAVETPDPNLSLGMKWLQGTWAMRFNRFRDEHGRPFQGRFRAQHVEPGHALGQVVHYIHLNPLRAKAVTAEAFASHRWSSLHHFPRKDRPACLEPASALVESGGLKDTPRGWASYVQYLVAMHHEDPREREESHRAIRRGWCVGSKEFKDAVRRDLKAQGAAWEMARYQGAEPTQWQEIREAGWHDQLERAARVAKIDLSALPRKKSAAEKVLLAAAMKHGTSVSNGWLAERLQMGQAASVSQYVRRFRMQGGQEGRRFQRILSRIKK